MPREDNLAIIIITQLYIRYVLGRFGPFRNLDFQCFIYQIKRNLFLLSTAIRISENKRGSKNGL